MEIIFALFLKIIHCIPFCVIFHQLSSQRVTVHPELVHKIPHNWKGIGTSQSEQAPAVKQEAVLIHEGRAQPGWRVSAYKSSL